MLMFGNVLNIALASMLLYKKGNFHTFHTTFFLFSYLLCFSDLIVVGEDRLRGVDHLRCLLQNKGKIQIKKLPNKMICFEKWKRYIAQALRTSQCSKSILPVKTKRRRRNHAKILFLIFLWLMLVSDWAKHIKTMQQIDADAGQILLCQHCQQQWHHIINHS